MFTWIYHHLATILVCAVLLLVVFLILRGMIKDRRAGKSLCGGSCASCPMGSACGGNCGNNAGGNPGENAGVHESKGDGRSS